MFNSVNRHSRTQRILSQCCGYVYQRIESRDNLQSNDGGVVTGELMKISSNMIFLAIIFSMMWPSNAGAQSSYDLRSPDNRIEIRIRTADRIRYDVLLKGKALLENCTL